MVEDPGFRRTQPTGSYQSSSVRPDAPFSERVSDDLRPVRPVQVSPTRSFHRHLSVPDGWGDNRAAPLPSTPR